MNLKNSNISKGNKTPTEKRFLFMITFSQGLENLICVPRPNSQVSYYNLSNVCLFVCSPTPPRSLGRSSPNLEGRWRAAPDISLRGSFFERSRSSRSKVKFMFFFCLFPYFSQVLGPIFTKLGGKVEGGPRY